MPIMRDLLAVLLLAASAAASAGCNGTATTAPAAPPTAAPSTTAPSAAGASIGTATMKPDGTIVLMLRAEGPGMVIGDGMFTYPTTHKDYAMVLKHVGGLVPGQSKPVPPWP